MLIYDLQIMLSLYKSNKTIMSLQPKWNIGVWSLRQFNVEIASNKQ